MRPVCLLVLLVSTLTYPLEGDVRTRLCRRFPACRGTLEGIYAGDEMEFFHRVRFSAGEWDVTLLLDKSRGEDWVGLVAGGACFRPGAAWVEHISAGWLEADLGSGLVLAHPGAWSSPSELEVYKPPVIRDLVRPASSPGDCRGAPLTGVGLQMRTLGLNLSLLGGFSMVDATGEGHYRTESEIDGRGDIRELLGAVRISNGWWGTTAAAGSSIEEDRSEDWVRGGFDWDIHAWGLRLTGEAAAGADSSGVSPSWWAAVSREYDRYRHTLTAMDDPSGYPSERASPPMDREGKGLTYGFRWNAFSRFTVTGGAGAWLKEGEDLARGSMQFSYRFPFSMECTTGFRMSGGSGSTDWRGWASCSWQPSDGVGIGMKVQLTGADPDEDGGPESGSGLGLILKWEPVDRLSARLSCATFSTDGYSTRVYYPEPSFPGEFGSSALWGEGFLLGASLSAVLGEGTILRGRVCRHIVEGAEHMGSGWEETEGGGRTELGIQLDWSFP